MRNANRWLVVAGLLALPAATRAADPVNLGLEEDVTVTSRTIEAVNFRRPGSAGTHMELRPTSLAPGARGQMDIDSKEGYVQVQSSAWGLPSAATLGDEYMTYVLWGITPEGRPTNLGEFIVDGERSRLEVTSELQTFGMIVTAEPHFAVTMPSDVVVMEVVPTAATAGKIETVEAKYQLLERGHYAFRGSSRTDLDAPSAPFYIIQARNARRIAMDRGAMTYAADTFDKGERLLDQATDAKPKEGMALAKQAAQTFEDARIITEKAMRDEREAKARAEADSAKAQASAAMADADAARRAAADAEAARQRAEAEKAELRERLRQQFAVIFDTRETARGLILSMSNVLFDFNKATLRPEAREKLARLAGVIVTSPGLNLAVEGHADAIGTDAYNQVLSEKRAESVRGYLVENGVPPASIVARGFGESRPIASNDTDEGRQLNRRVEIVVTGDVIGFGQ